VSFILDHIQNFVRGVQGKEIFGLCGKRKDGGEEGDVGSCE